jgi:hypothetical protein
MQRKQKHRRVNRESKNGVTKREAGTFAKRNKVKRKEDLDSLREFANDALAHTTVVWYD